MPRVVLGPPTQPPPRAPLIRMAPIVAGFGTSSGALSYGAPVQPEVVEASPGRLVSPAEICDTSELCGQRALAYVCQMGLGTVIELARTKRAMTYAQIRAFISAFTPLRPTEIFGEHLRDQPRAVWNMFGGERFLALLPDIDPARPDEIGHVVVMDGRSIVEGQARAQRVSPDVLAGYPVALVFSAREVGR